MASVTGTEMIICRGARFDAQMRTELDKALKETEKPLSKEELAFVAKVEDSLAKGEKVRALTWTKFITLLTSHDVATSKVLPRQDIPGSSGTCAILAKKRIEPEKDEAAGTVSEYRGFKIREENGHIFLMAPGKTEWSDKGAMALSQIRYFIDMWYQLGGPNQPAPSPDEKALPPHTETYFDYEIFVNNPGKGRLLFRLLPDGIESEWPCYVANAKTLKELKAFLDTDRVKRGVVPLSKEDAAKFGEMMSVPSLRPLTQALLVEKGAHNTVGLAGATDLSTQPLHPYIAANYLQTSDGKVVYAGKGFGLSPEAGFPAELESLETAKKFRSDIPAYLVGREVEYNVEAFAKKINSPVTDDLRRQLSGRFVVVGFEGDKLYVAPSSNPNGNTGASISRDLLSVVPSAEVTELNVPNPQDIVHLLPGVQSDGHGGALRIPGLYTMFRRGENSAVQVETRPGVIHDPVHDQTPVIYDTGFFKSAQPREAERQAGIIEEVSRTSTITASREISAHETPQTNDSWARGRYVKGIPGFGTVFMQVAGDKLVGWYGAAHIPVPQPDFSIPLAAFSKTKPFGYSASSPEGYTPDQLKTMEDRIKKGVSLLGEQMGL